MWKSKHSVILSLVVCFIVAAVLIVSLFAAPYILNTVFSNWRGLSPLAFQKVMKTIFICYYPSAILGLVALAALIKMLFNIKKEQIFIKPNIDCLRIISWCCFIVCAICLLGLKVYFSLIFVCAAAGFMGLILRVVKNVMQSAIELKDENDLTI